MDKEPTESKDEKQETIEIPTLPDTELPNPFVVQYDIINLLKPKSNEEFGPKVVHSFNGLQNQGATCYMNSVLQSLFHIPAFRRLIFSIDTEKTQSGSLAVVKSLQLLFAALQLSKDPCSTEDLTKSFGWGRSEVITQYDVQEFTRVLLDHIEVSLNGSPNEDGISKLFRGKIATIIKCTNVDLTQKRVDQFYDISLVVKSCSSLADSFNAYIAKEVLTGSNQYQTDKFGKQDAEIRNEFLEFPSILFVHLKRFEYDPATGTMNKVNSYLSFPEAIDLKPFLSHDSEQTGDLNYRLYGVLVHSGATSFGHYYAFLCPNDEEGWYKFNDSYVIPVPKMEAIDDNFGNLDTSNYFGKNYSSYMLIYVNRSSDLFSPLKDSDIPHSVVQNFNEQQMKAEEERQRIIEKANEMIISVYTEDCLDDNLGFKGAKFSITAHQTDSIEAFYNQIGGRLFEEKVIEKDEEIQIYNMNQFSFIPIHKSESLLSDYRQMSAIFCTRACNIDNFKFLLYIYCPVLNDPLRYSGIKMIPSDETLNEYAYELGVEGATWAKKSQFIGIEKIIETNLPIGDKFSTIWIPILILTIGRFMNCPENLIKDQQRIMNEESEYSFFDYAFEKGFPDDVSEYISIKTDKIKKIFEFRQENHMFEYPSRLDYSRFIEFLSNKLDISFDKKFEELCFFPMSGGPSTVGIPELSNSFHIEVIPKTAEILFAHSFYFSPLLIFSDEEGYIARKRIKIIVDKNFTVGEMFKTPKIVKNVDQMKELVLAEVHDRKITRIYGESEKVCNIQRKCLLFALKRANSAIKVKWTDKNGNKKEPFMFDAVKGEIFEDSLGRLGIFLGEDQMEDADFYLGNNAYQKERKLGMEDIIWDGFQELDNITLIICPKELTEQRTQLTAQSNSSLKIYTLTSSNHE